MNNIKYLDNMKRIAIIAHADTRKGLIEWSYLNKNILKHHIIISTARTALLLEGTLNVPVLNLNHGKAGGYGQVQELLESGKIDILIFFGNPLPHDNKTSWYEELAATAIKNNVVVAYNQATIDMLLEALKTSPLPAAHQEQ
jgi:methylglyoxal synthase